MLNLNTLAFVIFLCNAGAPGLIDPCEKNPTNTLATMEEQQREDITSSAQVMDTVIALRMCALYT